MEGERETCHADSTHMENFFAGEGEEEKGDREGAQSGLVGRERDWQALKKGEVRGTEEEVGKGKRGGEDRTLWEEKGRRREQEREKKRKKREKAFTH